MTSALREVLDRLRTGPLAGRVVFDAPLGARTTYRVGGSAAALVELATIADASALAETVAGREVAVVAVGRGSNLLVADEGFAGVAVVLGAGFATVDVVPADDGGPDHDVVCGAAAKLPVVARTTVQAGLTGFEWAVGVPGSVGGAVRMNAGGHGAEMKDSLIDAEVLDLRAGRVECRDADALAFAYRTSSLRPTDLVLTARLRLSPGDPDAGRAELAEIVQWRRDHQPGGQNAGSVFTNPPGDSAGRLIDAAGLKGLRIGSAVVSDKHANFIQADPDGRAADVAALMAEIVARVRAHSGVELHAETHMIGFGDGD